MEEEGLTLDFTRNGKPHVQIVTAKLNGDTLTVDTIDLLKEAQRERFVRKLCDGRLGLDRQAVERELLAAAHDAAESYSRDEPTAAIIHPEIDAGGIVRPERFVTPQVSGLAVPAVFDIEGRPAARWLLYLRWADGTREQRSYSPALDLPGGDRLYLYPQPGDPPVNSEPSWSRQGRAAWLEGRPAPDPAELFKRLCERVAHYLDFPGARAPGATATLALWAIFSYVYSAWDAVPYLFVGGPQESGKTRVFDVLGRLVFRPLSSSNLTAPTLFRTLHNQGGVLLLDEVERLKDQRAPDVAELLSMLLAGYKRGGQATRMEPVGDSFKTVSFDVYGPKALACIAGLPPALASRCITLMMFRAAAKSPKPARRLDDDPACWRRLRDDLHMLALEHGPTWLRLADRKDVCPEMSGRSFQIWQPLLALAAWIESHGAAGLLGLLQEYAMEAIEEAKSNQTPEHDELLLRIAAREIAGGGAPTAKEILQFARDEDPDTFGSWSAKAVANHLRRYGLTTRRSNGRSAYSQITDDDLLRIQSTYGVELGLDAASSDPGTLE